MDLCVYISFKRIAKEIRIVRFYGTLNIVRHSMSSPFHTYIKYMISKHIFKITFLNKPVFIFL